MNKPDFRYDYRDGAEGFITFCEDLVRVSATPPGELSPEWFLLGELPDTKHPVTGRSYKDFWEHHKEIARECLIMENGEFVYRNMIFCWMRGDGKCFCKGSETLMFDGSLKKVEDIKVNDLLMGDDNKPKTVLSLGSGKEEMFEVTPMRGDPFVVTGDHMLTLKRNRARVRFKKSGELYADNKAGEIIDISVRDYQKTSGNFKKQYLLYKIPIEFPEQEVLIDPYFLGLWLGDGHSCGPTITTMDEEIVNYLHTLAMGMGLIVSTYKNKNSKANAYSIVQSSIPNILLDDLREYDLIKNKHIPQEYKANSRDVRLKLLAGIIDSDGSRNRSSIDIIQKSKKLSYDIAFIARSLGFHVYVKKCTKTIKSIGFTGGYYRIGISGDCSIIPTLVPRKKCTKRSKWKDVLVTGIRGIKSVGEQEYYGFQLDGNGRYVTGDFTVTHNSFLVCLIFIWKWLCFPKQQLVLCANSKDQSTFVHYEEIVKILQNSPKLLSIVGSRNIQQKELRLRDEKGDVVSRIFSATTFTGILSNIGGYTFSEFFDLKNHKFFEEIDTSTRNITNAFGIIDTTVSAKSHPLHHLYQAWLKGEAPKLYFSYRCSPQGKQEDFWHPNMTQDELDGFRVKHHIGKGFDRFFKNIWEAAEGKVFTPEEVEAIYCIGYNNQLGCQKEIIAALKKKNELLAVEEKLGEHSLGVKSNNRLITMRGQIKEIDGSLWMMDSVYQLSDRTGRSRRCTLEELNKIGDLYDTDWAVMIGMDRAGEDLDKRSGARTIITAVAKGLPQSRTRPEVGTLEAPNYLYIVLSITHIASSQIRDIKQEINLIEDEYNGIDTYFSETWQAVDLRDFCEDKDIVFDAKQSTFALQKASFQELYLAVESGRFKSARVTTEGAKGSDILHEEFSMFEHDPDKKWFGSPEKKLKNGVQDDAIFSIALTIYGGRFLKIDDFEKRSVTSFLGEFYPDKRNIGDYH